MAHQRVTRKGDFKLSVGSGIAIAGIWLGVGVSCISNPLGVIVALLACLATAGVLEYEYGEEDEDEGRTTNLERTSGTAVHQD